NRRRKNRRLQAWESENCLSSGAQIGKAIAKIRSKREGRSHVSAVMSSGVETSRDETFKPAQRDSSTALGMTKKLKPQHILHRIKPWRFSHDPFRGAQCSAGKDFATRCSMRQLQALC